MRKAEKHMTGVVCTAFFIAALGTGAAEPVWPADFAAQVAANIAAETPSGGQIGMTSGTAAITMRDWGEAASAGYGTPEDPFDSFWRSIGLSDLGILNTRKPRGITINFR